MLLHRPCHTNALVDRAVATCGDGGNQWSQQLDISSTKRKTGHRTSQRWWRRWRRDSSVQDRRDCQGQTLLLLLWQQARGTRRTGIKKT
jgi:hypothetical protein